MRSVENAECRKCGVSVENEKRLSALSTINLENFPFSISHFNFPFPIPVLVTSMRVENETSVIWELKNNL